MHYKVYPRLMILNCQMEPATNSSVQPVVRNDESINPNANGFQGLRLPKLFIPISSDDPTNKMPFDETITSFIHHNQSLSNVAKFQYFVSPLTGAAAKVIQSIELNDANYIVYSTTKTVVYFMI